VRKVVSGQFRDARLLVYGPNVMSGLGLTLVAIGALFYLAATLWQIGIAITESAAWGLFFITLAIAMTFTLIGRTWWKPPVATFLVTQYIFVFAYWPLTARPLYYQGFGLLLATLGAGCTVWIP